MRDAAWPLLRSDLGLSYAEIGLLLALPNLLAGFVEPAFGLLADTGRRRFLVLGGGVAYAAALAIVAAAWGFVPLFVALTLLGPASGAFVGLSQATLIDLGGDGPERGMARWVAAGSVGVVAGPVLLSVALLAGVGWRATFAALALLGAALAFAARCVPFRPANGTVLDSVRQALAALGRREVLRWLMLKDATDLMGDVLFGFLALYFVDVVGVGAAEAALALAALTAGGLVGDLGLVAILRRVPALAYLRATAVAAAIVFPAFLLVPGLWPKVALVAVLGAVRAGWYAIPKGRLFAELPGRSGVALALSDLSSLPQSLVPLGVGLLASQVGLGNALWAALLAPLAILVLVPRQERLA
ncbi:MAG TPA: MFS transporter [Gaiellaceae bacterium]|nr:MFS transporter [Gaiellaceae bacterium]